MVGKRRLSTEFASIPALIGFLLVASLLLND